MSEPTAATTAPQFDAVSPAEEPLWPALASDHPLSLFSAELDDIIQEVGFDEVYGIHLRNSTQFQKNLVLQKFLRANQNDLVKAKAQLSNTLAWRKKFEPLKCISETHSRSKFDGLGYILKVKNVPESINQEDVITFNIYGAVSAPSVTFGDKDEFLRWRVGLMELSLQQLNLPLATEPIPDFGHGMDPYQAIQCHDYLNVSFIRQDPNAKAAAGLTIETVRDFYPETLSRKFFVNVPRIMGWLFATMKLIIPKGTAKKFTVLTWGRDLAGELGPNIPKEYGGNEGPLADTSRTLQLSDP